VVVFMGDQTLRETLNRVLLTIDLARFLSVRGLEHLFPTDSVCPVGGKMVLPRDKFIGVLLEETPRVEQLQSRIWLLVECDTGFEPGFLASPQMSERSVPRLNTAFRCRIGFCRLPGKDVLLVFVQLAQAFLPLTFRHILALTTLNSLIA
jgi:hypothetical protein